MMECVLRFFFHGKMHGEIPNGMYQYLVFLAKARKEGRKGCFDVPILHRNVNIYLANGFLDLWSGRLVQLCIVMSVPSYTLYCCTADCLRNVF